MWNDTCSVTIGAQDSACAAAASASSASVIPWDRRVYGRMVPIGPREMHPDPIHPEFDGAVTGLTVVANIHGHSWGTDGVLGVWDPPAWPGRHGHSGVRRRRVGGAGCARRDPSRQASRGGVTRRPRAPRPLGGRLSRGAPLG